MSTAQQAKAARRKALQDPRYQQNRKDANKRRQRMIETVRREQERKARGKK